MVFVVVGAEVWVAVGGADCFADEVAVEASDHRVRAEGQQGDLKCAAVLKWT